MKTLNLFAEDDRLEKPSKLGNQLKKLNCVINWNIFEPILKGVFAKETKARATGRHIVLPSLLVKGEFFSWFLEVT